MKRKHVKEQGSPANVCVEKSVFFFFLKSKIKIKNNINIVYKKKK